MTKVFLDDVLRAKLLELRQPLDLCDETGKVVGRVMPIANGSVMEPQLSEEELLRRESEPDYSTAEVLARLEKL